MQEPIEFVSTIQLLGINISTDIDDRHISDTVRHFYLCIFKQTHMYRGIDVKHIYNNII